MVDQVIQFTDQMVGANHPTLDDTLNRLSLFFALTSEGIFQDHYIKITDTKAVTTAGGTFTSGADRTRDLTQIDSDAGSHASINLNQITLDAGDYIIRASAPAFKVDAHKARLWNATAAAPIVEGTSEYTSSATDEVMTRSIIFGRFTIAAAQLLEILHRCTTTQAANGFGNPTNFGVNEIYTVVELIKVA